MGNKGLIYLGKAGKIYGPYSEKKVDELRMTGELLQFSYIWDEGKDDWLILDQKPPKPGTKPSKKSGIDSQLETADAICHDFNAIVAGKLQNVSDMGCDLVSRDHAGPPLLGMNTALVLNVLNPKGKESTNVKAAVYDVTLESEGWIYHLRWAHPPSF